MTRQGIESISPIDSALALVSEQCKALKEALPEVLEERPVYCLQCVPGCSIHRHIQLCDRLQISALRRSSVLIPQPSDLRAPQVAAYLTEQVQYHVSWQAGLCLMYAQGHHKGAQR